MEANLNLWKPIWPFIKPHNPLFVLDIDILLGEAA